jgi:4'-phosphopantetheinyl transferase
LSSSLLTTCRFVKEDDRKRALVSRLLQYSLVHHVLRIPFHQISICRTPEGKPYLNNCSTFPNFNFNTSHQGDYVGIASEPICLVGLDIVSVSKTQGETTTEFISNFSSYLTGHEWDCIVRDAAPSEVLTEFYRYWCLKEAFVKAIGAGVGFGLHRLEFHHEHWTNISIHVDGELSKKWRFWIFKLDEMHLASIAKGHPEDAVSSFKKTLSNANVVEEQLHSTLGSSEEAFTFRTVEQLTQSLE